MKKYTCYLALILLAVACKKKVETTNPELASITESVYASGYIKSEDQFDLYAKVSGRVQEILVKEGDTIIEGQVLFQLDGDAQQYLYENATLAADYASVASQKEKLKEAQQSVQLAKEKNELDSMNYIRQDNLWKKSIGSKVEWESRKLQWESSKSAYQSSLTRLNDLKRQIDLNALQSRNNQNISKLQSGDYSVRSLSVGRVYSIGVVKGDWITPQKRLAVIGSAKDFVIEMQVDEFDITQVKDGQKVIVSMDSYKNQVFEALVTKIFPLMNERTKTFKVEARFVKLPEVLFPNTTVEANIILQTKTNVLLIPRRYLKNDSTVIDNQGNEINIKVGLKDYDKVEITQGLSKETELQLPTP